MLFCDLPIYMATWKVYRSVDQPGSDRWLDQWEEIYALVLRQLVSDRAWTNQGIPWTPDDIRSVWRAIRKNKATECTCEVAVLRGSQCFYFNRGLDDCSDEVNLDRLVPGSRGGLYIQENCVIACSRHNQMKSDKSMEDFLLKQ